MKHLVLFLLVFFLVQVHLLNAQHYAFSEKNETYEPLSRNAVSLTGLGEWDDPWIGMKLPFDFYFFGVAEDSIYISDYIAFDFDDNRFIEPFYSDWISRMEGRESKSHILYETIGTISERILKIEWRNVGFYEEKDLLGTTDFYTNVQLFLYEKDNSFEMRLGEWFIEDLELVNSGDPGPQIYFYKYEIRTAEEKYGYLVGTHRSPILVQNKYDPRPFEGMPASGTVYRFEPRATSIENGNPATATIRIFPNPASDVIFLSESVDEYRIFDTKGRIMLQAKNSNAKIDLSTLPQGMYILSIEKNGFVQKEKFIKK